jgi:6,7-dimethyl-8-ribityllumazine synthase
LINILPGLNLKSKINSNMATSLKPEYNKIPSAHDMSFGIVVSEWHPAITESLLKAAYDSLISNGANKDNIQVKYVPGSFELTLGAQFFAEYTDVDAVICLGCVIQGETPHFKYICKSVSYGITELNMQYNLPFIFGVLTTSTYDQALERAGGKLGNKGEDAAITAIKMVALHEQMEEDSDQED